VSCTQNLTAAAAAAAPASQQRHDQQWRKQIKQSRLPLAHAAGAHSWRAGAASGLCAHGGRQTLKVEKGSAQQEEDEEKDRVQCTRNHGVACRWRVAEVESSHARAHAECAMAAARKIHENNYDIFESTRARPSTAT